MKKRLAKLVAFLLLGMIVNVFLALACAWWSPTRLVSSDQIANVWPAPISFDPSSSEPWPEQPIEVSKSAWFGFDEFIAYGSHRGDRSQFQSVIKAGLPVRSLYLSRQHIGADVLEPLRFSHPFPTRPLWPGFAFNTIFYAAILWTLLALLRPHRAAPPPSQEARPLPSLRVSNRINLHLHRVRQRRLHSNALHSQQHHDTAHSQARHTADPGRHPQPRGGVGMRAQLLALRGDLVDQFKGPAKLAKPADPVSDAERSVPRNEFGWQPRESDESTDYTLDRDEGCSFGVTEVFFTEDRQDKLRGMITFGAYPMSAHILNVRRRRVGLWRAFLLRNVDELP